MAVFLGGLDLTGREPGPRMVEGGLDLTYLIIWSLALANVVGAGACLLISQQAALLTTCGAGFIAALSWIMILNSPSGLLQDYFDLPWPIR